MSDLGSLPLVYLITPGQTNSENYTSESVSLLDTVRASVDAGISIVQFREKLLPPRLLLELIGDAVKIARGSSTHIFVNDRVDVAIAAGAQGVHLRESSMSPRVVRSAFSGLIVGRSVHSIDGAKLAAEDGVDYILFGPVFETPGKRPAVGLERLSEVCAAVRKTPVIALGGIDEHNCTASVEAGAAGIAAIRGLNDPGSRDRILAALR